MMPPPSAREPATATAVEVALAPTDLGLTPATLAAALGYRDRPIPEHFAELLADGLRELPARCAIRAGYRLLPVGRAPARSATLTVGDTVFATQRRVARQLAGAEHVAVFVATIGPGMEQWAQRLMHAGDPAHSYLIDTLASAAVEAVAGRLHDHLAQVMQRQGWAVTNRYSPGYCGWAVAEQHPLFALLPAHFCGITLTDSALMQPIKSVSGFIGVGPAVQRQPYHCDRCGVTDCTYRAFRRRTGRPSPA